MVPARVSAGTKPKVFISLAGSFQEKNELSSMARVVPLSQSEDSPVQMVYVVPVEATMPPDP